MVKVLAATAVSNFPQCDLRVTWLRRRYGAEFRPHWRGSAHLRFGAMGPSVYNFDPTFFFARTGFFLAMTQVFQSRPSTTSSSRSALCAQREGRLEGRRGFLVVATLALALAGCGAIQPAPPEPAQQTQGMFGPNGIPLFSTGQQAGQRTGSEIGVNAFLWRATLDTIAFLPLASADPFGGVIITDWYAPPTTRGAERFKLNVLIKDRRLRSDGVKVTVFRQERAGAEWRDADTNAATGTEIENAILTRARQMWLDAAAAP